MRLSIIIPCYNCAITLKEAVTSIYTQDLTIPFEVVMVDDGSTDSTRDLIKELALQYQEIRYIFHETNKGGGAARNTAVAHCSGTIIFCLDSDDILPDAMLPKMILCLQDEQLDGVVIGRSLFFMDEISNIVNEITYEPKELSFKDLFSADPISVVGNFLYTKAAFLKAGGYPEQHGFDTQGFGFRILANQLKIKVCPDAFYYQRIPRTKSYYIRELEAGNISKNWFYILNENLYMFSRETQDFITHYDYTAYNNNTGINNIFVNLCQRRETIFNHAMLALSYSDAYERFSQTLNRYDQYWCGVYAWNRKEYGNAFLHFQNARAEGFDRWQIFHYTLMNLYLNDRTLDYDALFSTLKYFSPKDKTSMEKAQRLMLRIKNKLIRTFKGKR